MKLKEKVAVVTGGARGIGRAVCERYADEGARVVVADILEGEAQEAASAIGRGALAVRLDVTRRDSIDAMVETVAREAGGIDVLVNNAAIFDMGPLLEITEASYDKQFAVNVKACCSRPRRSRPGWSSRAGAARSSTSPARPAGAARPWSRSTVPPRPP
jgi:D-sorbitol dehydrogenase (acceptor)